MLPRLKVKIVLPAEHAHTSININRTIFDRCEGATGYQKRHVQCTQGNIIYDFQQNLIIYTYAQCTVFGQ